MNAAEVSETSETPHPLREIKALPPFATFPLLSRTELVPAQPAKPILPVYRLLFAYPAGRELAVNPMLQHVKVVRRGLHKPRSFTPTGDPSQRGVFELTVKAYPGGSSEWLTRLPIGSSLPIIGPLPLPVKSRVYQPGPHVVVVALGIGITLGLAGVRHELRNTDVLSVILLQAVRYCEELVFADEFEQMQRVHEGRFTWCKIASGEVVEGWRHGRVDESLINSCVEGKSKHDVRFLVVGTKAMMKQVWHMLNRLDFSQKRHALVRKRV